MHDGELATAPEGYERGEGTSGSQGDAVQRAEAYGAVAARSADCMKVMMRP